ncbi:Ger(x)C family spore germination protein [Paenibacillus woosongensis]|uniref:Ger(X)C family spore germination protein n=1 Tax=Paenibacillus woosongensis TaxID=307580 RepID=A0AA95I2N4_9BACL|nr:Ger(x)C family spore germination protein [Paenibacillus woosongensis]WHX48381.1 Ger(x)C family spore germination protein [Paenibacillus woosongensis]
MKRKFALIAACKAVLLSGCWDAKEPQSINFITALGIDYVKGEYTIYAQVLAFGDISKQESSVNTEETGVWIATGKGETISKALMSIYPASQQKTLWTHVKAIVFSKSLLNSNLGECLNSLLRSSELRYTPWVYGTEQDIPSILSGVSLLNQSALNSELMDPREVYEQLSTIEPLRLMKLINGIREPAATVLLPSIKLTDKVWSSKEKPISLVRLDGAYVISKGENKGYLDDGLLNGARWVAFKNMHRYPLLLKIKDGGQAQINILNSEPLVKVRLDGGQVKFTVKLKVTAAVSEVAGQPVPTSLQIKEAAAAQIKQQITGSFHAAKAKNIDIYGLEDMLYRRFNRQWKKMTAGPGGQDHLLSSFQLEDADVDVKLMHSSTYKLKYH